MTDTDTPGGKLARYGRTFAAIVVLAATVALVAGLVQLFGGFELAKAQAQARAAEALARRLEAQADLAEQHQQTIAMLPGAVAAMADTALATGYAIGDRLLVLILGGLLGLTLARKGGRQ